MIGPDALIAIAVIAALLVLIGLWVALAYALSAPGSGEGDEGADWGGEHLHNEGSL